MGQANSSMQNMSGADGTMGRGCDLDGCCTLNANEQAAANSDRNTGIGNLPMRTKGVETNTTATH